MATRIAIDKTHQVDYAYKVEAGSETKQASVSETSATNSGSAQGTSENKYLKKRYHHRLLINCSLVYSGLFTMRRKKEEEHPPNLGLAKEQGLRGREERLT